MGEINRIVVWIKQRVKPSCIMAHAFRLRSLADLGQPAGFRVVSNSIEDCSTRWLGSPVGSFMALKIYFYMIHALKMAFVAIRNSQVRRKKRTGLRDLS